MQQHNQKCRIRQGLEEMGQVNLLPEVHGERIQARALFFEQGELPDGLVDPLILRSWERCRQFGLADSGACLEGNAMDRMALKTAAT